MPSNRPRRRRAAALAGALVAALAVVPAAHAATGRTVLANSMLRGLSRARAIGPLDGAQPMTIGVGLAVTRAAEQQQLIADLYDPHSPSYHHFLTPAQWEARFGASPARFRATAAWLRSGGLRVTSVPGTRDYLVAAGTAVQVQRLLDTRLERLSFQGHTYFADTRAPSVPSRLGILGISGLNDFEGPRPAHRPAARAAVPQGLGALSPSTNTGNTQPSDLWSIYDEPSDNKGDGQKMAIFGWGTTNNTVNDMRLFEAEHGFPAIPVDIRYFGAADEKVTDSGGEGEWNIDTQASTGMAPDAAGETLYFGKSGSDPDLIAAYNAWAGDANGALQGSSSFGGCEQAPGTDALSGGPGSPTGTVIAGNANQQLYETALAKLVAEGRTMFASTGDTGAGCPAVSLELNGATIVPTPMLNYPAVSPNVVAVGGTVLYFNDASGSKPASRAFEYGWPYGGGGSSLFVTAPRYQSDAVRLAGRCLTNAKGAPNAPPPPCRGIPDVSAQSGDIVSNGYAITEGGAPDQSAGGTSLSSPLWLGMWTRIQAAQANPAGNGFANPSLYKLGPKSGMFFDVGGTSGDTAPTCNGEYCSTPGWDYVTGWGTPDVKNLMVALDGGTAPVRPAALNAAPTVDVGSPIPCPSPQMADRTGDAPNSYPGGDGSNIDDLDIESVAFGTTKASDGSPALGVTMKLKNLGATLPPNMLSALWDVYWSTPAGLFDAEATRDGVGPATQYTFFLILPDGSSDAINGTAKTGADGTLQWVIPVADIGAGGANATLVKTFADTRGSFTVQGTGLRYTGAADRAPDKGFASQWPVGTDCATYTPPAAAVADQPPAASPAPAAAPSTPPTRPAPSRAHRAKTHRAKKTHHKNKRHTARRRHRAHTRRRT